MALFKRVGFYSRFLSHLIPSQITLAITLIISFFTHSGILFFLPISKLLLLIFFLELGVTILLDVDFFMLLAYLVLRKISLSVFF